METQEIWKDIPGYEGLYQVSNLGNVKSSSKNYINKDKSILLKGKYLKGYISYALYNKTIKKEFQAHRLVAQAFLGLDINNIEILVCHKNDIKNDNRVENLFLGSALDNMLDKKNKGRCTHLKGVLNGMSKYSEEQIIYIKKLIELGFRNNYIEKETGVSFGTISNIRRGISWKHI